MKFSLLSDLATPLASSARAIAVAGCISFVVSGVGCSGSSGSSKTTATDAAGASDTAAPAPASAAADASSSGSSDATLDDKTKLPSYPGASVTASAGANGQAGTVLATSDSFDKVYDWYKSKMPSGSEKAKVSSGGMSSASFVEGDPGAQKTVAITTQGDKTTISLAATGQ